MMDCQLVLHYQAKQLLILQHLELPTKDQLYQPMLLPKIKHMPNLLYILQEFRFSNVFL